MAAAAALAGVPRRAPGRAARARPGSDAWLQVLAHVTTPVRAHRRRCRGCTPHQCAPTNGCAAPCARPPARAQAAPQLGFHQAPQCTWYPPICLPAPAVVPSRQSRCRAPTACCCMACTEFPLQRTCSSREPASGGCAPAPAHRHAAKPDAVSAAMQCAMGPCLASVHLVSQSDRLPPLFAPHMHLRPASYTCARASVHPPKPSAFPVRMRLGSSRPDAQRHWLIASGSCLRTLPVRAASHRACLLGPCSAAVSSDFRRSSL